MFNVEDAITQAADGRTVLIAGPTASGKSSLALRMAAETDLPIVNADALQVFSDWRILTARPSEEDEAAARHLLYGHVPGSHAYSTGEWLRDVAPILAEGPAIIVGGTGLNFSALIDGMADIPPVPEEIRQEAENRLHTDGVAALASELDSATRDRIDLNNPMRVFRAWTVQQATGRGLASWHDETPPPLLAPPYHAFVMHAPVDWLTPRIDMRFGQMLDAGILEEARANAPGFSPDLPSAKAIGARELIEFVTNGGDAEELRTTIVTQTRQYAKRQRTWFRNRFSTWARIDPTG